MPSISTITPASFDTGRSVTLTGTGFGSSQGTVTIGGVSQTVTSWSDTSITFTSVRGAQSMGACRVDVVKGSGTTSGALQFTPTYLIDAENATLGAKYEGSGSDQWTDAAFLTIAQNDNVLYGAKAWRCRIVSGTSGFGTWGGRKAFPNVGKGGSVHCQWSVFLPTAFDWYAAGGGRLKFFRLHTSQSDGSNRGYQDIYIETLGLGEGSSADGRLAQIYEGSGGWKYPSTPQIMQKNAWETFEFRVDFSDVPVSSGGTGRVRFWRKINGAMTLVLDVQNEKTLAAATDVCDAALLFTYWNGEPTYPTTDQICYADRIVIETDTSKLVETDANGYKIIGGI